jgi:hypothetical protein
MYWFGWATPPVLEGWKPLEPGYPGAAEIGGGGGEGSAYSTVTRKV